MTIYKRQGSRNYYCEFRIDGRVYVRSTRTTNKAHARRFKHNLRESIYRKKHLGDAPSISIQDAINLYQGAQRNRVVERNLQAQINALKTQMKRVVSLQSLLEQLTSAELEKLLQLRSQDGVSDGTTQQLFVTVKGVVGCAQRMGFAIPVHLVIPSLKVVNGRDRILSAEEEKRLLEELSSKAGRVSDGYDLVVLLLDTAARLNEIQQLQWKDVDLAEGEIRLWRTKTKTETVIKLTGRAKTVLTRRRNDYKSDQWVFPSKSGDARRYTPKSVQNAFKRAGLVNFKTHDLRHTAASKLIRNGLSLYELSKLMGHASVQMTQRYAHLEQNGVAEKAAQIFNGLATDVSEV